MRTAAVYARVSTGKQSTSSVEDQLRKAQRFERENGFSVVQNYWDAGICRTAGDPPAFAQMMLDAQAREFDVIYCGDRRSGRRRKLGGGRQTCWRTPSGLATSYALGLR